jgi:hypothetical protein
MNLEYPSKVRDEYWVHAYHSQPPHDWTERSGKWLIFVPFKKIDEIWQLILAETIAGRLGLQAKAATAKPNGLAKNKWVKVICVYTYDSADLEDVRRVRDRLREIGFTKKLSYKTDQTTEAGVYAGDTKTPVSLYYE